MAAGKDHSIEFYLTKMGFEVSATSTGHDIVHQMAFTADGYEISSITGDISGEYILVSDTPFIGTSLEGKFAHPTCDD